MKQLITFFAAVVLLAAFTPTVWAYNFSAVAPSGQTLYYNIVDGNAEVTSQITGFGDTYYNYPSGDLTIPSTVTNNGTTYSVTSIGESAFRYCSGLTSVTIPNTVTSIGSSAFSYCSGLTSVTIPNAVTSIGSGAFYNCSGLTAIIVESDNTVYDSRNNCNAIIETATNTLLLGCENTTIPNAVTSIGSAAFYNCSGLTSITIPNSVTTIESHAFYGCSGLNGTLIIPNAVTSIGKYVFTGCTGLTSVTIGNSVTSIGESAFCGCTGLTGALNIPSSVTSIGSSAFNGCSGITEIYSPNSVAPYAGEYAFEGITLTTPVYIPCGSLASYMSRWSYFSNFIEDEAFTFSAVSADNNMGAVQILTMPTCTNPQAVIYASANSGYRFDHWSDGNTANPRVLTVTEDTELTGYFVPDGGGSQGIDDITSADGMKVYTRGNTIVIDFSGQQAAGSNQSIVVCDVMGRVVKQAAGSGQQAAVEIPVTSAGVYMVKVGDTQPQKVVVRR